MFGKLMLSFLTKRFQQIILNKQMVNKKMHQLLSYNKLKYQNLVSAIHNPVAHNLRYKKALKHVLNLILQLRSQSKTSTMMTLLKMITSMTSLLRKIHNQTSTKSFPNHLCPLTIIKQILTLVARYSKTLDKSNTSLHKLMAFHVRINRRGSSHLLVSRTLLLMNNWKQM